MKRDDIVVLENLQQEDDQPRYLVVLAKEIENHAADGSSYDYSLDNNESECEYDMMKAIEKKFGVTLLSWIYLVKTTNSKLASVQKSAMSCLLR